MCRSFAGIANDGRHLSLRHVLVWQQIPVDMLNNYSSKSQNCWEGFHKDGDCHSFEVRLARFCGTGFCIG